MTNNQNNLFDSVSGAQTSRRTVLKAAAWAAPVVAVAAAAPIAAATTTFDSPTAFISGTITATGTASTPRTATYPGGVLSYDSAGVPGVDSGELTITLFNGKPGSWTLNDINGVVAAYQAAGWVLVGTASNTGTVFAHPAIHSGETIVMPKVVWSAPAGSTKPTIRIDVTSDSDDVTGIGVTAG